MVVTKMEPHVAEEIFLNLDELKCMDPTIKRVKTVKEFTQFVNDTLSGYTWNSKQKGFGLGFDPNG